MTTQTSALLLCVTVVATLVSLSLGSSCTHSIPSFLYVGSYSHWQQQRRPKSDNKHTQQQQHQMAQLPSSPPTSTTRTLPSWILQQQTQWGDRLVIPEWEDEKNENENNNSNNNGVGVGSYRTIHGWKGHDLLHGVNAAVRIWDYYFSSHPGGGVGTTLTGIVEFTPRAESHAGYCHGGSMCSVMDDVMGWCGFLVTGQCRPWSGYTVQVNTSLQTPIPVGAFLVVVGTITHVERRKVSIEAKLMDTSRGDDEMVVHATGQGLVIVNKGVLPET